MRLKDVWGREEPQRSVVGATLEIIEAGQVRGTIEPRMNFYPGQQQPVPTPDVRSTPLGDLYANLQAFRPDGSNATVKLIHEPLVPWIWLGGLVVVFGALIGIAPSRRGREAVAEDAATFGGTVPGAVPGAGAGVAAPALPRVREEPA